jgi:hypothetical protein
MGIVTVLAPGLRAALGRLAMLADYPLLGLVRDAGGQVQVLRLMGFSAEESSVELDPDAAPPGTLLLADPDEMPMLVLDPWLIFARCPECSNTQVAALAGQRDVGTDYFGLDCGHVWPLAAPPAPVALDLAEAEAPWTPDEGALVESPTALHLAMAAQFEREQQAMAAERAAAHPPASRYTPHVVTAEELEAQTRALDAQIHQAGERQIVPEQATMPEEEERLLAEYRRLEEMQTEAERRFEERTRGNA